VPRYTIAALALFAALPACDDTPSYELRWDVAQRGEPDPKDRPRLTHAFQCSQLGIMAVTVTAIDELGDVANVDVFPCFPEEFEQPDRKVAGSELRSGKYALEVRGVQRDREPWIDPVVLANLPEETDEGFDELPHCRPNEEHLGCEAQAVACACQELDVVADETYTDLDRFFLTPATEECVDGIDNDVDGFVDVKDPGCSPREGAGSCDDGVDNDNDGATDHDDANCVAIEGGDVGVAQFRLLVTILDLNPVATCGEPLTSFLITARGDGGEPLDIATVGCRINGPIFFAREILGADGPFTIEVTGLDAQGNARTKPIVGATMVESNTEAVVELRVDFGEDDFDPPLEAASKIELGFESVASEDGYRGCDPPVGEGRLVIASTTMSIVDLDGNAVSSFPPFDGVETGCATGNFPTHELAWGGYRLIAEASEADGTVCFATAAEGVPLAPGEVRVTLPRVLVDGRPPLSCIDCIFDAECASNRCEDFVCQ
jgi:hypothetical protein